MMRYICIILLSLSLSTCYSQVDKGLIENWKSVPIPTNEDTLLKYNWSQNEWRVFIESGKVRVAKQPNDYQPKLPFKFTRDKGDVGRLGQLSVLKVDDGYLIGRYIGEWGGSLYWFSNDGRRHYEISHDEVVQFITRAGKIYAIQGLAHMLASYGSIINIKKTNGKWIANEYIKLPFAPYAIAFDNKNNFIVITSENLLKIDAKANITQIIGKGIWSYGLYPNSIVVKDDIVYSGMRAGVYKFNLSSGLQEWLLND